MVLAEWDDAVGIARSIDNLIAHRYAIVQQRNAEGAPSGEELYTGKFTARSIPSSSIRWIRFSHVMGSCG
jgi:hypothetical protein